MLPVSTRQEDSAVYVTLKRLMSLEADGRRLNLQHPRCQHSVLFGRQGSRLRGRGLDFEELRQYQPGDDLRHLDWRTTLRTGKPFVRSYTEERDRPTLILCDQRMGMFFGSQRQFKSVTAAELTALIAWSAFHGGDRVGGLAFNDQRIDTVLPHRSRERLQQLFAITVRQNEALTAQNPVPPEDSQLDAVLRRCLGSAFHDHTICLISDFSGASNATFRLVGQLAQHNNVIAFQVYDPIALNLPKTGRLSVIEGELQVSLNLGQRAIHQPVARYLRGRLAEVQQQMRRHRIPLLMISAGEPTAAQYQRELGMQGRRIS